MWIDSHAHLFDYTTEALKQIIEEASVSSVSTIVSTATNIKNSKTVVSQCKLFNSICGVIGVSPFDVENQPDTWLDELSSMIKEKGIIGIGEIGIDKTNPRYPPYDKQLFFFNKQLALAKEHNLPVVIHSRGAEEDALEICLSYGINKALFHCFTGTKEAALRIVTSGYYISLSGIITFKSAEIRETSSRLPLSQLLIETDSPYLAPVPHRGQVNKPSMVRLVGEELAKLQRLEPILLQNQLETNFNKLFFAT